jgi:site-specific recombinase XerD
LVDRYSVATIDRRLSSIGYYHKQARHALPTKDPEVERTMRGIRRAKGIAPNGKTPILTPLLCQMVEALPDDLAGLRDKAMLLIGFAGAFRRSEIVGLHLRDVQISDVGLIITLRRSKTDQGGPVSPKASRSERATRPAQSGPWNAGCSLRVSPAGRSFDRLIAGDT